MKLVYTVCTSNYLYQAFSLGDSLKQTNPDYELVIGLVDELPIMDFLVPYKIIPISALNLSNLQELSNKYSVIELVCACKPIFGLYLLDLYPDLENVIYLDTDINVYQKLTQIEENLENFDITITPHITKAIELSELWNEKQYLNSGLYNAGFVAFKRTGNTQNFLIWWKNHTDTFGYLNYCKGMGADQLCLNFVPIFFEKVLIDYYPGNNAAYWNLHERTISSENEKYLVNKTLPLIFFHFSGYNPEKPKLISKHNRIKQENRVSAIHTLFSNYHQSLVKNHYHFFKGIIPAYGNYTPPKKERGFLVQLLDKAAWKAINFIENY